MLSDWQSSGASLGPMIDRSPALKEIKPLAQNLTQLGATGLEAVSYLETRHAAAARVARGESGEGG